MKVCGRQYWHNQGFEVNSGVLEMEILGLKCLLNFSGILKIIVRWYVVGLGSHVIN